MKIVKSKIDRDSNEKGRKISGHNWIISLFQKRHRCFKLKPKKKKKQNTKKKNVVLFILKHQFYRIEAGIHNQSSVLILQQLAIIQRKNLQLFKFVQQESCQQHKPQVLNLPSKNHSGISPAFQGLFPAHIPPAHSFKLDYVLLFFDFNLIKPNINLIQPNNQVIGLNCRP